MVQLISSPWRTTFDAFLKSVDASLLVAAPFIKLDEAERLASVLSEGRDLAEVSLTVLTDFRPDSVLNGALDIEALYLFNTRFERSAVISVPRLHAKVYVADRRTAVITSANLTNAGLDQNMEYGVQLEGVDVVDRIAEDLMRYATLGSAVPAEVLRHLTSIARDLTADQKRLLQSARADFRRRFNARYRVVWEEFIATQVGRRSANAVFSEAILYLLSTDPLSTTDLHPKVRSLLPDLCDDDVELVINGEHFGKKWKHQVRNAQQALKRVGRISFDGKRWHRV